MRRGGLFALLLPVSVALALRLPDLGNRPMHADESVHALKFRTLWEQGRYTYDRNEYHGPTLYYAALPVVGLSGRRQFVDFTPADYRRGVALVGGLALLALALLSDGLGSLGAVVAGLLLAVSSSAVFYGRTFIQESLLVAFTLLWLGCAWRYAQERRRGWLFAAAVCAGLMLATKETAVLSLAAGAVALRAVWRPVPEVRRPLAGAACVALLLAAVLLSGFGSHPAAMVDFVRSFGPWLHRAHGSDLHQHAVWYYLQKLCWTHRPHGPIWSEGLIVGLGAVGALLAWVGRLRSPLARFLSVYAVLLTAVYSLTPYKTPWCVLNLVLPLALLAGHAVQQLVLGGGDSVRHSANVVAWVAPRPAWPRFVRGAVVLLFVGVMTAQLGWQAYRLSFRYQADARNPYAYAPTHVDVEDLTERIEALAKLSPVGLALPVQVYSADGYYWPLPWYLRRLPNVGYLTENPAPPFAPVVIASTQYEDDLEAKLGPGYQETGAFALRYKVIYQVWVTRELWAAFQKQHN